MQADDKILSIAERLIGLPVRWGGRGGSGANSSVVALEAGGSRYALKRYPNWRMSGALRCRTEWHALKFLYERGMEEVPEPIACEEEAGVLIFEWIEGGPVADISNRDVDVAADFVVRTMALSADPSAGKFSLASEACLSGGEILRQVVERRASFVEHKELNDFLECCFDPALEAASARARSFEAFSQSLAPARRCLIPADFGLHNALRESDGRLRFFDFDYFGWDDPVKLTADFCLHPAMDLQDGQREGFVQSMAHALPSDKTFIVRLRTYWPLYALRWSLIVLNIMRRDRVEAARRWPDEHHVRSRILTAKALVDSGLRSPLLAGLY